MAKGKIKRQASQKAYHIKIVLDTFITRDK